MPSPTVAILTPASPTRIMPGFFVLTAFCSSDFGAATLPGLESGPGKSTFDEIGELNGVSGLPPFGATAFPGLELAPGKRTFDEIGEFEASIPEDCRDVSDFPPIAYISEGYLTSR